MFFLSLPLSAKIGDTVDCKINGEPKKVTWRDRKTLVIEPNDARLIMQMETDTKLRHFFCGDSEADGGTKGITIIKG